MGRQMFAQGGHAYPMQDGGAMHQMPDGSMMPDSAMPPPQGPAPAMPGMPPADMANVDINQAAQGAIQQGIDPTVLEEMLGNYASQMEDLDDAEDYETVMNGVRGDRVPVEGRYAELAEVVGPEDARATPESVLTLLQPVMMLAAVDQGIGGLAQEEMSAPIEGAMAEGIMSTVNMGAPEAPVQVPGGPAPVNFNQGGAVQYMAPGGVALPLPESLEEIYGQRQSLLQKILSEGDAEAEYEDQKEMTKAQMLFDVAQGALAFASPGDRNMSPAERLAQSFSPVLGSVSARAGDLEKFKQSQTREQRALNLQAFGSAEQQLTRDQAEDAASRAAALASQRDSAERVLDRGHELLMQGRTFNFSKEETETNHSFSMRLANRKIEAQNLLQQLQGAQSQDQINLRGRLTTELAQLNNSFAKAMQDNTFDFTTSERESAQGFRNSMVEKKQANDVALIAIQFDNSKESLQLRQDLEQENMALGSELRINEIGVNFDNQLERDNKLNIFEISRMGIGHDFNVALADHKGSIAREARLQQQGFTAAQNVLDRAQREQLTLTDQTFRKMLQDDMQQYNLSEADTNRAVALVNRGFDEALALRGADQKDTSLSLAERAQLLDEAYKMGMLGVERLAANATRVGSKANTDKLTYLTNPGRMSQYAQGTLGDETALYEQAILDYTVSENVWDNALGKYVQGSAGQLAPALLENIRQGNPALFAQITGAQLTADAGDFPKPPVTLMTATSEIMNLDGSVNRDSPIWDATPPSLFDPGANYREVVGASRIFPMIGKAFSEGTAEFSGGDATPRAKSIARAATSLDAFANDLLQYNTSGDSGGRILKFVQLLLERETANIRPGGFLFKTDADAQASLETIAGSLEEALRQGAAVVPEYGVGGVGATADGYTEKQVTQVREEMNLLKGLFNNVLAFQKAFGVKPVVRSVETGNDQSTATLHNQINSMRKEDQ